ncbi:glycosyltransferase family 2 protein [Natrialbaceae archaeon A-arb3/5]
MSVITATYNRGRDLSRAIDSVLSQTFTDFEYLIVDDGSSDNTPEVVDGYDDGRIKYIRFEENRGANVARNTGIKKSSGDYISILDSDDKYHPERLEKTVQTLDGLSDNIGGVFHPYQRIENGRDIGATSQPEQTVTLSDLRHGNKIGSFLAVLFRSEVFDKVGLLDEEMVAAQDYEYYLRVLQKYDLFGISEELATYYLSSDSISKDIQRKKKSNKQLLERHESILSNKQKSKYHYSQFFLYANNYNLAEARRALFKSLNYNPYDPLVYYYLFFSIFGWYGFKIGDSLKKSVAKHTNL